VLLLGLAFLLPALLRWPLAVLAGSALLYLAVQVFRFNLRTYPEGVWYFNPFAWQILFVIGAVLALTDGDGRQRLRTWPGLIWVSASFVVVSLILRVSHTTASVLDALPGWAAELTYLIADKNTLGPIRLLNFLALAHVTVTVFRRDQAVFRSPYAEPIILCGQHSLNIFCLGIFLSFFGHLVLVEVSRALPVHIAVSAAGILIMFGSAYFLVWSKQRRRPAGERATTTRQPPQAAPQGGQPPQAAPQGGE
jgi:hypothetical protein